MSLGTAEKSTGASTAGEAAGLELARVMLGRGVPVLLLDGLTSVEASEAGAAAVLEKPFDRRELRAAVRAVVGGGVPPLKAYDLWSKT